MKKPRIYRENTARIPRDRYAASIKTHPGKLAGFPPSKITFRVFGKGIPVRSAT
jgi:hypothetical protein